jgi:ribonuclease HII
MSNRAVLVDDDDNEIVRERKIRKREPLNKYFVQDSNIIEIGTDEVGRGPLFGRVYSGAVVLPKDDSFDHSLMKDSKRFTSCVKLNQAANYIKENAVAWAVCYEDENIIDDINILQASQRAMHRSIAEVYAQLENKKIDIGCVEILVDGDYFNKFKHNGKAIIHHTIKGGDDLYTSIAAASILAKVERDAYIADLCDTNVTLVENYGINTNKGYGSKKHLDGIKKYGITQWHRKTFGICRSFS